MLTLAIIGRPNVGKSTLFNKLAGKQLAIVDDTPGVTRDWREADGHLFDMDLRIIDTAGLEEAFDDSIHGRMRQQTEAALAHADAALFLVDGRSGITPLDEHFASWLRRQKLPVIPVVNKCENEKTTQTAVAEAYALGLGDPVAISAEHGIGMEDIYHALDPFVKAHAEAENLSSAEEVTEDDIGEDIDQLEGDENFVFEQEEDDPDKPIKIAIVGRPNVGKSTLLNAIVNEQRVMTGPEAGITRDAITVDWTFDDRKFKLVDTAGMRRKAKVQNQIERMSVNDSLRAIRLAQVVVLVVDAQAALEKQDLQIAEHIIEEGRALVIAVNKWDTVSERQETLEELQYKMEKSLAQMKNIPFVTLSAIHGHNVDRVLKKVLTTYEMWNKRISTSSLNRWLSAVESRNAAPLISGRRNRLKYMAQIKTRPPTFVLWVSRPDKLPPAYRRYIMNGLRKDYDIPGVPIRLLVRKSKNPFA